MAKVKPEHAERALQILRFRGGQPTEVILTSGRRIVVSDVAWGRDIDDEFDNVTANASPPTDQRQIHFFFTSEISAVVDPSTGETLFEGPPGLRALSPSEQSIVKRCLEYVLDSPALKGDFVARIGVSKSFVRELLKRWPEVDRSGDSGPQITVRNALNEVAHGLLLSDADCQRLFRCTRSVVASVFVRWAQSQRWGSTA